MFDPTNSPVTAATIKNAREQTENEIKASREKEEADRARMLSVAIAFEKFRTALPEEHAAVLAWFEGMKAAQTLPPQDLIRFDGHRYVVDEVLLATLGGASMKLDEVIKWIVDAPVFIKNEAERKAAVAGGQD